jgi:hypothetical protein
MTGSEISYKILIGLLLFALQSKSQIAIKIDSITLTDVKVGSKHVPPALPTELKVSAYLIFDDKSVSSFDVLNNKTIALWNTVVAGGGDVLKPSHQTKVVLSGRLDSLRVKILNGKRKVVDQVQQNFVGESEFIINNTGCEEVKVIVTKKDKIIYQNKIPFKCGE